nr:hypothetical protein [Bacillus thuringiensis]
MVSVTQRISKIKQPRGGYVKPKDFDVIELNDGIVLYEEENIHSALTGLAVDYLTRFTMETSLEKAFRISLIGCIKG